MQLANFLGKPVARRPTENFKQRLGRKSSLVEFYKAPLRYLKASNTIESAFEKPYRDLDYQLMHLDIPAPDWPTWNFAWEISRGGPQVGEFPGCRGCGINHWDIRKVDCATKPVNFHASWWCSSEESMGQDWKTKGVGDIEVTVILGEILSIEDGVFSGIFPDKDIYLNPAEPLHILVATMTDIYGTPCVDTLEQECEVCECPSGTFAFDDGSTDDTIDPGGTISIYIVEGCPPYSWSVSGTGYSLGSAQTTTNENTLTSANGACGVAYALQAKVTVTDNCGEEVEFTIRNTGGSQWVRVGAFCNNSGCAQGTTEHTFDYVESGCRWDHLCTSIGSTECSECGPRGPGNYCPEDTESAGDYCTVAHPCCNNQNYEEWRC